MPRHKRAGTLVHRWAALAGGLILVGLLFEYWPEATEPLGSRTAVSPPVISPPTAGGLTTGGLARSASPAAGPPPVAISYPVAGPRRYDVVPGRSAVIGRSGDLYQFRVAVEQGITGVDRAGFARFVTETYADPRGWAAAGERRFQRVPAGEPADFVVYLVTPGTRDALCGDAYDRYTSCRSGERVVVNVARWAHGVPGYGASLETYRQYVVNHETGHRFGYGHELCPGSERPAPVMQQQTLGRHGCVANAWPEVNGREYHGASGQYHDPVPPP